MNLQLYKQYFSYLPDCTFFDNVLSFCVFDGYKGSYSHSILLIIVHCCDSYSGCFMVLPYISLVVQLIVPKNNVGDRKESYEVYSTTAMHNWYQFSDTIVYEH